MGLELPCLYTTQVNEHIDCLLRHGRTETITSQLLDSTSFDNYGHLLTKCWIKDVWYELHTTTNKGDGKNCFIDLEKRQRHISERTISYQRLSKKPVSTDKLMLVVLTGHYSI